MSIYKDLKKIKAAGEKVGESEGTWHNLALISDTGSQQGVEKVIQGYNKE